MAFRLPTFNLLCNIWHSAAFPVAGVPDISDQACQLAWDRTADTVIIVGLNRIHAMKLRVPKLTDLRGLLSTTNQDTVEVPSGSGRWYQVWIVDDVAKGFTNEYRQGLIFPVQQPTPLP